MINNLDKQQNLELYKNWDIQAAKFWQEIARLRQISSQAIINNALVSF